jgi:hypothetical protein
MSEASKALIDFTSSADAMKVWMAKGFQTQ